MEEPKIDLNSYLKYIKVLQLSMNTISQTKKWTEDTSPKKTYK